MRTNRARAKKSLEERNVQECHVVATEDLDSCLRQMESGELLVEQMFEP